MYAIPDNYYTIDAAAKTITLSDIFATLNLGQIASIVDITSGEVLYEACVPIFRNPQISISGGVITYKRGNFVANTDKLRILFNTESGGLYGGTA